MSLDGWNPRTQPLKSTLSHKPATLRLPSSSSTISYKPFKVEKMVRVKEVKARVQQKSDQKKEATTSAPTPPPAPLKKTTAAAKQPKVNRDYEFNDGDDQMWHATWCLDSWNKPGSKTLLLFQLDCQDEPTWEPFEGHNEDSCLAADFFHWRDDRPRPAGWKPPAGWTTPETRPPPAWFIAEDAAHQNYPHLFEEEAKEAKLATLEPLHRQIKLGSHSRSASAKIKVNGAKKLIRDSRRSGSTSSWDLEADTSSPRASRGRRRAG
ncbi:hypothetical protein IWZ00DRAFT_492064 [Phyllosticta capitalensis]|uniref:uncharacterized protein n=1 Tax=Phyllosticta capitalensis TaxID=121624 RepID=UPI00312F289E